MVGCQAVGVNHPPEPTELYYGDSMVNTYQPS